MEFIFFDTETCGLPINWKAPMTDLNNWPRVIQLAWLRTDKTGNTLSKGNFLIKPDGWEVPTEKFWTDNGFSQEDSLKNGVPLKDVLEHFIDDLNKSTHLVSHNMSFDYNVLGAELLRADMKGKKLEKICTKEIGTNICKIPGFYGKYKWPKLIELHEHLFKKGFDGAHDALVDVIACKDCFFEMMEQRLIPKNILQS